MIYNNGIINKSWIIAVIASTVLFLIALQTLGQQKVHKTLHESLGDEFVLHKGQSAIINKEDFSVKIVGFYNSPCPKGARCIWSGIGIGFEYRQNSRIIRGTNRVKAFGYRTTILKTDYKTYALLRIDRISRVQLHIGKTITLDRKAHTRLEAVALKLVRSSNFNSVAHSAILKKTVPGIQRAYRTTLQGDHLIVTYPAPRNVKTIRGTVDVHEIVIGFGKQYANALFTIDSSGRVVQHEKAAGHIAIDLLKLVKKIASKR